MEHIDLTLDSIIASDFDENLLSLDVRNYNNPRNYALDFKRKFLFSDIGMDSRTGAQNIEIVTFQIMDDYEYKSWHNKSVVSQHCGAVEKFKFNNAFGILYERLFGEYPKGSALEEDRQYHYSFFTSHNCQRCGGPRHFLNNLHNMLCDACEDDYFFESNEHNTLMLSLHGGRVPVSGNISFNTWDQIAVAV